MDLIKEAQHIIDTNSGDFFGNMQEMLSESGDTELIALIVSEEEHYRKFFYAYSENYIFFFEYQYIPEDSPNYHLVAIPRHPTTPEDVNCFGGY